MCQALRGRVSELEAELAEQSHLRLQAAGESEFLKAELDDLRRVREDTEKEQRSLTEIESKAGHLSLQQEASWSHYYGCKDMILRNISIHHSSL